MAVSAPRVASVGDNCIDLYEEPVNATGDTSSNVTAINAAVTWRYVEKGANGPEIALPLRFLTGLLLAGVYPVGIKIVAIMVSCFMTTLSLLETVVRYTSSNPLIKSR